MKGDTRSLDYRSCHLVILIGYPDNLQVSVEIPQGKEFGRSFWVLVSETP